MKKIVAYLFVITFCLLMTSCFSLFPEIEEKPTTTTVGNKERYSAAINLLGSDMLEAVNAEPIETAVLEKILPESYTFYAEYSPSYEKLKEAYLSSAGSYAFDILKNNKNLLVDEILKLSKTPNQYITGDDTLSSKIRSDLWVRFYDGLVVELRLNKAKIEEMFAASKQNFEEIRKAYANLSNVGVSFEFDAPEAFSLEKLAEAVTDDYFDRLAWYEKYLKNTPAEAGTLYTVFWEN